MTDKPKLIIYKEQTFKVGEDTFIDSTAENNHAVVFEDKLTIYQKTNNYH